MSSFYDFVEDKALEQKDARWAIAYALLDLVYEAQRLQELIRLIGFGSEDDPGTTEKIAMELKRVADALEALGAGEK